MSNITFGQTIDYNCQDGKLYFKIKNAERHKMVMEAKGRRANINETDFLNKLDQNFGFEWVEQAFLLKSADDDLKSIFRVSFENPSQIDQIIRVFEAYDFIEYAEKVPLNRAFLTPNDPIYASTSLGYNWNWHLDLIKATQAWDISTGSSAIKVAIIDNAIWSSHPDLQNKIVAQASYVSPTNNSSPPSTVAQTASDLAYEWSHGTHCAGLVGAQSNNSVGIASIGYNVSLMTYRSADNNGDMYYTGYGEEWASNNGANVISMSYGGPTYSASENTWYTNLKNAGIVLVAAAGNDGVTTTSYPAGYTAVISVASVNEDLELSDFSQYGSWVDVAAPGGYTPDGTSAANVPSSTYTKAHALGTVPDFSNTYYDGMQGTSMACPIVAGLAGLLLSINPDLTPAEVENCIVTTTQAINGSHTINGSRGCINAYAAAQCAQSSLPTGPTANFTGTPTSVTVGGQVQFTDASTSGGSTITSRSWSFSGGTPSTSAATNPLVTYNTAGTYDVSLTVTTASGNDIETKTGYIIVSPVGSASSFTLDFEASADFANTFSPWTTNDVDGLDTYGIQGITFTHSGEAGSFIAFNPDQCSPTVTDPAPHGGDRFGACFAGVPANGVSANNDWLISPQIHLGTNSSLSLWVKSHTDQFGLERFKIGVSTTNNSQGSFTFISTAPYETAPLTWTEKTYSLNAYNNQNVYVAINCVSADAFILMIDDIEISTSTAGIETISNYEIKVYPNPAQNKVTIETEIGSYVQMISANGQIIKQFEQVENTNNLDISDLANGIYTIRIISNNLSYIQKLIINQ